MNIGQRLKHLRELYGFTQEDVGNLIGVTKATVNRYETGEIDIKRTIAIKLSEVFKVAPAYIMGWTDNPQTETKSDNPNDNSILEITELLKQLDEIDKAEIRGTIKGMLKSDKYKKTDIAADIKNMINAAEHLGIKQR